jgi:protease-4
MSRPWNEREQAVIRKLAQRTYDTFVQRVAESRGARIRDIQRVTQGRLFTARQAVANGLIDAEGGLHVAVESAKRAAKLDACHYLVLPRPRTLLDLLSGEQDARGPSLPVAQRLALRPLAERSPGLAYLIRVARLFDGEAVLTVLPYYVGLRP